MKTGKTIGIVLAFVALAALAYDYYRLRVTLADYAEVREQALCAHATIERASKPKAAH